MSLFHPLTSVSRWIGLCPKCDARLKLEIDQKKFKVKQPRFYTPFATKSPFLLTIFCGLLACIVSLEIAVENGTKIESNSDGIVHQTAKYKRQAAASSTTELAAAPSDSSAATTTLAAASSSYDTIESTYYSTDSSVYDTIGTVPSSDTGSTLTTIGNAYNTIESAAAASTSSESKIAGFNQGVYNTIETASTSTTIESTAFDSATEVYNTIETVSSSAAASTSSGSNLQGINEPVYNTIGTPTPSATSDVYNTIATVSPSTAALNAHATSTTTTTPGSPSVAYNPIQTSSPMAPNAPTMVTATSSGAYNVIGTVSGGMSAATETAPYRPVALTAVTGSFPSASTFLTTITTATAVKATITSTAPNGELQVTVVTSSVTSALTLVLAYTAAAASASSSAVPEFHATKSELQLGTTFTPTSYFCAMYLATFVAVLFKVIWTIAFSSTKMMEPFFQLSRPEGASAQDTLLADYLSSGLSLSSVRSVVDGHWVMLLTSSVYTTTSLLPSLASGAMTVRATAYCGKNNTSPCNLVWILKVPIIRGVQALLSLVALMVIVLVILRWPRRSGVFSNPSSIASMAALFSHRGLLHDIRRIDLSATKAQIAEALSGNRYMMGSFESLPGRHRYGLMRTASASRASRSQMSLGSQYSAVSNPANPDVTPSHNVFSRLWKKVIRDTLFLLCILGLFGVVLAYYLDSANDAFNRFFNSDTFAPRFILTLAATAIDNHWKRIEREVRIMTPYRRLHKRNAAAGKTILMSMNGTPISSFPLALIRGDLFHALVAFTAIMSDILILAVAGVPFAHAEVWLSFIVSAYVSLGILGLMVLVVLGTFWWRRGNEKMGIPRAPSTIAAVLMMLCNEGNGLRREFEGWEGMRTAARDIACKKRKGRYWAGRILEEDGRERWVVECEGKYWDEGDGRVAVNY
jgi:hypothetical protein